MKVLFIGDLVGRRAVALVRDLLPALRDQHGPEFVVVNVENSSGGFGVNARTVEEMLAIGVDVMTTGNHVWDNKEIVPILAAGHVPLIRPANLNPSVPGRGWVTVHSPGGSRLTVVNLLGRLFMGSVDDPFRAADEILANVPDPVLVDFHAEATSEKIAFGHYLDGRVAALIGTHTHVQTADERVLPGGTAYITDAGMTGPMEGVIGMDAAGVLHRFRTGMPARYKVAEGPQLLCGVVVSIEGRRATGVNRLRIPAGVPEPSSTEP